MREQEQEPLNPVRNELLERLRALETPQTSASLADLAYQRAREALEKALEEARSIRLQAIEDARAARDHEMSALMESLRALRQSAESQIETVLRRAEVEAAHIQQRAQSEADTTLQNARVEADQLRTEATALWNATEERRREVERLERELNAMLAQVGQRLGMAESPPEGWLRHLGSGGGRK